MANVYVEPRPKGRSEGSPIDDYVVEDHADHVLGEFKTQHDELTVLKKDFENAQRAYELVNGRLSETSLESESQQTNVAILTPAVPPIRPSSPKLLLNTVLAIFLGGLIGVGTVLLLEMKNRRVRSTEDLYESLGVPVLAVVTETRMKPRKRLLGFRRAAALPS